MKLSEKRLYVYVVEKLHERWCITLGGAAFYIGLFGESKRDVVGYAARRLSQFAHQIGQKSELRIRNKNGTFGKARTYPRSADPRRSKG